MKKLVALLLVLILAIGMVACAADSSGEESGEAETPAEELSLDTFDFSKVETVTPGVLTVGTSPDFAPYEFYLINDDGTMELVGFDIDLAQALADHMGLELEIVPLNFDSILLELQTGSIDLGIAGLGATPERVENFDFSTIYHETSNVLVVLEENKDVYTDFASLAGKQVGAQNGTIQMDNAQEYATESQIVGLAKATDVINEVLNGKLDAAIIETPVAHLYQQNYPQLYIVDVEIPDETGGNSVAVAKGNQDMLDAVNVIIESLLEDGTMDQYVADATDLAAGNIYEGLLEEDSGAAEEDGGTAEEGAEAAEATE